MKANLISIPVRNQQKALKFYTEKLGFLVKKNEDLGLLEGAKGEIGGRGRHAVI